MGEICMKKIMKINLFWSHSLEYAFEWYYGVGIKTGFRTLTYSWVGNGNNFNKDESTWNLLFPKNKTTFYDICSLGLFVKTYLEQGF